MGCLVAAHQDGKSVSLFYWIALGINISGVKAKMKKFAVVIAQNLQMLRCINFIYNFEEM